MPAPELETLVADLVRKHLCVPAVQANLVSLATTEEIALIAKQMTELAKAENNTDDETTKTLLGLIERVQNTPGKSKSQLLRMRSSNI